MDHNYSNVASLITRDWFHKPANMASEEENEEDSAQT